ncbi:hypothetical protein LUZ60_008765 [Juncus effusus]|nr:hypothetical protein LUZ60_008765 [Juncus effusus]
MSAAVCGKRSSSIFEELPLPTAYNQSAAKRSRCGPLSSPPRDNPILAHLRSLFPQMNHELLERALEASGNDIDSAIKSLTELHLESEQQHQQSTLNPSQNGSVSSDPASGENSGLPCGGSDGSEWVELFVREMMNASDVNDARVRASRALEVLEKSIVSRAGSEAAQNLQKENLMLKGHMEGLLKENSILKRAVAIQHERQKEQEDKNQELNQMKQLVSQYQEQVRNLEVTNYALTIHLQQAQQGSSMPGRFHPDVF